MIRCFIHVSMAWPADLFFFIFSLQETLMCLANVAAGSYDQIQAILDTEDLLPRICAFLHNVFTTQCTPASNINLKYLCWVNFSCKKYRILSIGISISSKWIKYWTKVKLPSVLLEFEVSLICPLFALIQETRALVQEAVWVISNIAQGGSLQQITALLGCDVIDPLCDHLSAVEMDFVRVILGTISDLLKRCPSDFRECICAEIDKCGGTYSNAYIKPSHDFPRYIDFDVVHHRTQFRLSQIRHWTHLNTHIHTYVHTYAHIRTHTYTYTHTFGVLLWKRCSLITLYFSGLVKIETLQQHDNEELSELAYSVIDAFFKDEEDEQVCG